MKKQHDIHHKIIVRAVKTLFILAVLFSFAGRAQASWPNGYTYSAAITVAHSQVPNTDQTNFPVAISGVYSDLATTSHGGKVTNANGFDIVFASDQYGLNKLNFERELYSPTTGQVTFWVELPALSHTTDTVFYMFYGNSSVTTDQSSPSATWDGNYLGVWHLNGNPSAQAPQELDSTANANHLTAVGTGWSNSNLVPGKIGNAFFSMNNNDGFSSSSQSLSPNNFTSITVSSWINTTMVNGIPSILAQYHFFNLSSGFYFIVNANSGHLRFKISAGNNGGSPQTTFEALSGNLTDGNWHYITATYSSGANPSLYVDGSQVQAPPTNGNTNQFAGSLTTPANLEQFLMAPYNPSDDQSFFYQGTMDEARISSVARSADWIATEYNNQNAPSTFYSVGAAQTYSGPPIIVVSPSTLSFNAVSGAGNPSVQSSSIFVSNQGGWTATANNSWITLSTSQNGAYSSTASGSGAQNLWVQVATAGSGLTTGAPPNSGSVTISSPSAVSKALSIFFGVAPPPPSGSAWSNGYAYSGAITVNSAQVAGSDQANFPVLVSGTYPDLATMNNGGKVRNSNGYDIIFTSDPNGLVPLNFERESYSPSGQVAFWVQIPNLAHSTNTTFYVFYGNPAVAADQSNKTAVWDGNYVGVWHMADNASSTLVSDSTANGNNGTAAANTSARTTAGKLGGSALSFNGNTDRVMTNVSSGKTFTWEAWLNSGSITTSAYQSVVTMDGAPYMLMDASGGAASFWSSDSLNNNSLGTAGLANNTWYHVVFERAGDSAGSGYSAYVNGVLKGQVASGSWTSSAVLGFGARLDNNLQTFSGALDEIRVSNVARSANWIATEYNNENNPASFYSTVWGQTYADSATTMVSVPNVVGQSQSAASTSITGAGLAVGTITTASSSTVPSGNVISENPSAGTSLAVGSTINLVVSTGPANVSVPNVVGQTQSAASTAITGAGLTLGVITNASSSTVPSGSVISENPTAGTSVSPGTSVSLVVSSGPANVSVPNVVGQTQSAASTAITGAGLSVGTITTASSSTVASGNVISQNPTAGTSVAPGSSVGLLVSTGSGSGGSGSGYGYYGTITVNASQVPNVDEVNFPVLVSGTYADLATTGNGGKVTSANGYDIIFTSDAAGLNPLKFERESYATTGQVAFWVQIPSLSHTTNTTFYVFYGNAAVTTDQSTKTGVWDSNYVAVWHLADNAGSTLVSDSTANANNGAAAANTNGKTTAGKIGGSALNFNGTTDRVTTNVTSGKSFTWEAWINSTALSTAQYQSILTIPGGSYMLMDVTGGVGSFWSSDTLGGASLGLGGMQNNTWYHVVFERSGDSSVTGYSGYMNGALKSQSSSGAWTGSSPLAIGARLDAGGQNFFGVLQEIRVSNIARSANWIATEYNNENNPSLFYTALLGQPAGGGGSTVAVPNVVGQTQSAASTAITGAGLTLGVITNASSSTVPSGSVISENPTAGTSVSPGTSVSLVVSSGPANVSVPNVVGQTQSAASTAITGAGLSVGTITTASSSTVASGNVISQNPTAGTSVAPGSSVGLLVSTGSGSGGSGSGYGYYGTITVNASQVPNVDEVNFPVLVSGTYADLATTGNGGKVTSANGYDIIFTSDAAGLNPLKFERESYATTGQVAFWVQIPNLSHTTNTTFYVFYGNAAVTTDQSTKTGVWDSNYVAVWHLADNAGSTLVSDSTANANNGAAAANTNGKTTVGKIGGSALNFNGTTDRVTTNVTSGKSFTWEAWINSTALSTAQYQSILTIPGGSYMLMDVTGGVGSFWSSDTLGGASLGLGGMQNNTWYHVVFERSGDSSVTGYSGYLNGALKSQTSSGAWTGSSALAIGARLDNSGQGFFGALQEIRVSNIARSANWIATEYNNENSPSLFYSVLLGQRP